MTLLEEDPAFILITKTNICPPLELIQALAKSRNLTEVYEFWDLFDRVHASWRVFKSCESLNDLC